MYAKKQSACEFNRLGIAIHRRNARSLMRERRTGYTQNCKNRSCQYE